MLVHHLVLDASVSQLGHGIHSTQLSRVTLKGDVDNVLTEAIFDFKLVLLVHDPRAY
jgi:hypothetical protein